MHVSRRGLILAASGLALQPRLAFSADEEFVEVTRKSDESVRRATAFLMKTMHRDGGCGIDVGQNPDIGCTAMVGLALLSQGNTPIEGPYGQEVRDITSFLMHAVDAMPSDDITSAQQTQLQRKIGRHAHSFFALLFLSQVLGEGWNPEPVLNAVKKLAGTITRSQKDSGDWGSQSWAPTLGTVMGWVSLRGAHFAGLRVEASANKTADYLIKSMNNTLKEQNRGNWMHTLYKNATGIRVLYAMGMENETIATKAWKDVLDVVTKDNTPFTQAGGEEFLAFHLITETMLQKGGADWQRWFPTIRDKVISVQNRDGSWTGKHCITSRTFCTAAANLVLTSPNRFLPISQQ
ncbi:MAG: hypothetical protein AAGG48_24485 [Planctomycetota bacterium]